MNEEWKLRAAQLSLPRPRDPQTAYVELTTSTRARRGNFHTDIKSPVLVDRAGAKIIEPVRDASGAIADWIDGEPIYVDSTATIRGTVGARGIGIHVGERDTALLEYGFGEPRRRRVYRVSDVIPRVAGVVVGRLWSDFVPSEWEPELSIAGAWGSADAWWDGYKPEMRDREPGVPSEADLWFETQRLIYTDWQHFLAGDYLAVGHFVRYGLRTWSTPVYHIDAFLTREALPEKFCANYDPIGDAPCLGAVPRTFGRWDGWIDY